MRFERVRAVGRRWRAGAGPLLSRIAPSERQRLFALTIVVGGVCGLAAVAFHVAIRLVSRVGIDAALAAPGHSWIGWTILVPALGGLGCGLVLRYVVPQARGSGIPEVKVAYVRKGGRLPMRDAIGKFVVSALQIGSGSSLGREGPTVQICAGIAGWLGRLSRVSPRNVRRLLPVGAAAGIAAAFNAPIAAVTFTLEEIIGHLDQTILGGVIIAAALSAVVERSILGEHPMLITAQNHGLADISSLLLYAALGVVAAGASIAFTEGLLRLRGRFRTLSWPPAFAHPAIGGLVTGVLAVLAMLALGARGVAGGGYETLALALGGTLPTKVLMGVCVLKLVATIFSYGSGGAGGIFAPALFIGGTLGGAFGALDVAIFHHPVTSVSDFALVGMGAVFAGIIRAPITSVLIIIEMTSGYSLILPLMIANMSCYGLARLARPLAIYDALLQQDGVRLGEGGDARDRTPLSEVGLGASDHVSVTPAQGTVELLKASAQQQRQEVLPVVDAGQRLVGIITTEDLALLAAEPHLEGLVNAADLMHTPTALRPEDDLRTAFDTMLSSGLKQLPVIDQDRRVICLIDEGMIARAYMKARVGPEPA